MGKRGAFKTGYDPRRNLNGRPSKGQAFTDILRRVGEEGDTMEKVARRVWELAKGGNMTAVAFLADRLDGKVTDRVQVEDLPAAIDFDKLFELATTTGLEKPDEK